MDNTNSILPKVIVDTTKEIYELVRQWCFARDQRRANEALRQIAIITGCIPEVPEYLNEKQGKVVVKWLQENHPNIYLWAISQFCVGHPATVWGMGFTNPCSVTPKFAAS